MENSFPMGGMPPTTKMRGTEKGNGVKHGNTFYVGAGTVVSRAGGIVVTEIYLVLVLKKFIIQWVRDILDK